MAASLRSTATSKPRLIAPGSGSDWRSSPASIQAVAGMTRAVVDTQRLP